MGQGVHVSLGCVSGRSFECDRRSSNPALTVRAKHSSFYVRAFATRSVRPRILIICQKTSFAEAARASGERALALGHMRAAVTGVSMAIADGRSSGAATRGASPSSYLQNGACRRGWLPKRAGVILAGRCSSAPRAGGQSIRER